MAATFEVHRAFHLPERSLFGLAGVIRTGMVEVGMDVEVQGLAEEFRRRVHGVEFVHPSVTGGEGHEPALLFSYSRPETLREWEKIDWPGKVLSLRWGGR